MNRKEEYTALLTELDTAPPALEYTVARGKDKMKKWKRARFIAAPLGSLVSFFAVFVLMINISVPFALACGRVPVLRGLAASVEFSPSLSAAVKNKYVQPIGLEKTENGVTMRIEYVIVDKEQLNIFYTLKSEKYKKLNATPSVSNTDGSPLKGNALSWDDSATKQGEYYQIAVMFAQSDMPDSLVLTCEVHGCPDSPTFAFTLNFDPNLTGQGEVFPLSQNIELDGQTLTVSSVDVCPTHTLVNLTGNDGNTKWLTSLSCYLEDEKSNRYGEIHECVTAIGTKDSPMTGSYRLESPYFSNAESLTLYITSALLLDKNAQRVKVDLKQGTADSLPDGAAFDGISNGCQLNFTDRNYRPLQLFSTEYYDESGNKHDGRFSVEADMSDGAREHYTLADCTQDVVYLSPEYTDSVTLDTPIAVKVK